MSWGKRGHIMWQGELAYCAMAALCVYMFVCMCKLLGCGCCRDLCICECCKCVISSSSPFISWLLSPVFLWPGEDRCSALTLSSDWPGPHPRYQPAPLWPWWPRSDRQGARCSSHCCCYCSACASGWLLQGAACPLACSLSALCAAPPALPPIPAGVHWADVTAQWTWTTAAKHIGLYVNYHILQPMIFNN